MKKIITIALICALLMTLVSCGKPSQTDVNTLNECYDSAFECYKNGFKNVSVDIVPFEDALNQELYNTVFSDSDFSDREFYFNKSNEISDDKSFQKERCKDTLIAVYLAYTLKNSPEKFEDVFIEQYTSIDFWLAPRSEFQSLLCNYYDLTEEELRCVMVGIRKAGGYVFK